MLSWSNLGLMVYFVLVALIGTLGNGIILLAYGNRWNSSKSTSVIFILILACVDLWTCLIVVPTIAVMEYREFEVPTLICRFYSFSKILIIISSLIMSFIALDRFLNIAVPHYRLLNPRRVKVSQLCYEESEDAARFADAERNVQWKRLVNSEHRLRGQFRSHPKSETSWLSRTSASSVANHFPTSFPSEGALRKLRQNLTTTHRTNWLRRHVLSRELMDG